MPALRLASILVVALGCGAVVVEEPDGVAARAGYSYCASPGNTHMCGGSCGHDACFTSCLSDFHNGSSIIQNADLGACASSPSFTHLCSGVPCADGLICTVRTTRDVTTPLATFGAMYCADESFAYLYFLNGRSDAARHSDRSAYDGRALPAESACPSAPGVSLCGGPCGSCAAGSACSGRSPSHPFGLCIPTPNSGLGASPCVRDQTHPAACGGALSCFTFAVDSESQSVADANSYWIDSTQCANAATAYPGGAFCSCPQ